MHPKFWSARQQTVVSKSRENNLPRPEKLKQNTVTVRKQTSHAAIQKRRKTIPFGLESPLVLFTNYPLRSVHVVTSFTSSTTETRILWQYSWSLTNTAKLSKVSVLCSGEYFNKHWESIHCLDSNNFSGATFELTVEQQSWIAKNQNRHCYSDFFIDVQLMFSFGQDTTRTWDNKLHLYVLCNVSIHWRKLSGFAEIKASFDVLNIRWLKR